MDFDLSDEQQLIRATAREFADAQVVDRSRENARNHHKRATERGPGPGAADLTYAAVDSPFGALLVASSRRGLVQVAFPEQGVDPVLEGLSSAISPRILRAPAALDGPRRELEEYFAGRRREFNLRLDWSLVGPFGRRVLAVAQAIAYGSVRSYSQVAAGAGSPRGFRATGRALGSNPLPIVVPCHRVLRTGGGLGGYAGGLERKRLLLDLEGAPVG